MKGLILAGGKGTRLRPITHTSAKQLLPVANKPILFYAIEQLVDAGITDLALVTGETGADIRAAVGDGSRWGATVTYVPQGEPLGLAHAVACAREFLGDDDFVMHLGDNLLEHGVAALVEHFGAGTAAHIALSPVDDPHRFGVAEVVDGRIVRLVEKPLEPPSNLAMVGVYVFSPAIHEAIAGLQPSARGEYEIVDAISALIATGHPVHHEILDGWWLDTGKKDSLLEANGRVLASLPGRVEGAVDAASTLTGNVIIEAGTKVSGSTIEGPVIIGADAVIDQSHIGPCTSIGPGTQVIRSTISTSVLLEEVRIEGVDHLTESLIGHHTTVTAAGSVGRAIKVLLGDHCLIEVGA